MRIEDQLIARARVAVESFCRRQFRIEPIPDEVWRAITGRDDLQSLCFQAAQGTDPKDRLRATLHLGLLVAGAVIYSERVPYKGRGRYLKQSVQDRYRIILAHVALLAVSQYATKVGFITPMEGRRVIQDFDIEMHKERVFTSQVDWRAMLDTWNRRGIGKKIPSVEAFQKTCRRALAALERQGKPIPWDPWIRSVIYPAMDKSKHERNREERQDRASRLIDLVDLAKELWKANRLSPEQWALICQIHNDRWDTDFTPEAFRHEYQRARRLSAGYDPRSGLSRVIDDLLMRCSRTWEEYSRNLDRFAESWRKGVDRFRSDENDDITRQPD